MKNRITELRKALKLTQEEFSERLGMKRTGLSMIETGGNPLTEKNIKLICMIFNVHEPWLRTGEGPMFDASPYENDFFTIYKGLLPETQQALVHLATQLLETQEHLLRKQDAK
jgi:transcriptional regulator with XRE-family HTH domain